MKSKMIIVLECGVISKVSISPSLKDGIEVFIQDCDIMDASDSNVVFHPSGTPCCVTRLDEDQVDWLSNESSEFFDRMKVIERSFIQE